MPTETLITDLTNVTSPAGTEEVPVNVPGSPDTDGKIVLSNLAAYVEGTLGNAAGLDVGTTAGTVAAGDDSRLSDARTPTSHASTHTNGTDDIQDATSGQKGLMTAAYATKLDGIEAAADVTDATNVAAAGALMASALGTGVATALGVNVGSAGAPVVNGGALGTPSSGTLTNCTNIPTSLVIACSDETTALTTGTAKVTFRMPRAMTLTGVRASVTTAPTGSTLVVDINEGGTSILSTKLSIDATEKTSTTAATAAVISDTALADDAEITIDIDQIGSTIAGAGLKVALIGYWTS